MEQEIEILKGIHPGHVLEKKLKELKLLKGPFAISIGEYPQTLGTITKGKRSMNTPLALKIENALGLEEGYFMILQIYYDIKEEKRRHEENKRPDFSKLRRGLFWDTAMEKIDWNRQRRAVIQRVLERGNDQEKNEIKKFYGNTVFNEIASKTRLNHAG